MDDDNENLNIILDTKIGITSIGNICYAMKYSMFYYILIYL